MSDGIVVRGAVLDALAEIATDRDRLYLLPVTLGVDDMAKLFQRSASWVRTEVRQGTFPVPHVADLDYLLWTREDVEAWLKKPAVFRSRRAS
jgi:hypothetical protein